MSAIGLLAPLHPPGTGKPIHRHTWRNPTKEKTQILTQIFSVDTLTGKSCFGSMKRTHLIVGRWPDVMVDQ